MSTKYASETDLIAVIIQSQTDWNELTIYPTSSIEDFNDQGTFYDITITRCATSTAHTFQEPDPDDEDGLRELADFDEDQWLADIDICLAKMGYLRTTPLDRYSDYLQTCAIKRADAIDSLTEVRWTALAYANVEQRLRVAVLAAVAAGAPQTLVAEAAGINRATVRRWTA